MSDQLNIRHTIIVCYALAKLSLFLITEGAKRGPFKLLTAPLHVLMPVILGISLSFVGYRIVILLYLTPKNVKILPYFPLVHTVYAKFTTTIHTHTRTHTHTHAYTVHAFT